MPATTSCVSGRMRDERSARAATALMPTAARTPLRWNGSRASGSPARSCGSTANASIRRSGPRRSGTSTSAAISRLRAATTFSVPSSSRTAAAHEVGPWTRTPLPSAMPPNLTGSSMDAQYPGPAISRPLLRSRGGAQRGMEPPHGRARSPVADRLAVELDDRQELADRRGGERLLGGLQRGDRVDALLHGEALSRGQLADGRTGHPGEDPDLERRRVERVARAPPDVRRRAFEDDVPVGEEDGVVGAAPLRLRLGGDVHRVARRLHPAEHPGRAMAQLDRHAERQAEEADPPLPHRVEARGDRRDERETERRAGALAAGRPVEPEARVGRGGRLERLVREVRECGEVGRGKPDPLRGRGEALEVRVEPERAAAVDARRLERGAAAQERGIVGEDDRLGRVDDSAAGDGEGEQGHAAIASRSGRAFTQDSSTSAAGSESATTPPPTQRWIRSAAIANVRIVSARSKSPFGWSVPSAPIEAPRPTGSCRAISPSAAIFGAPVTEPPGNVAARISGRATSGRSVPSTVETRCATPASACLCRSSGQRTEPGSQIRERSLRSRSTIIVCSAASFVEVSSSGPASRGLVPLMGIVQIRLPRRARKSSGDAETIAQPSPRSGGGVEPSRARRAASASGSPAKAAARCWTRLTW